MSGQEKSLFLKKDGWIRFVLWALAIACVGLGVFALVKIMQNDTNTDLPNDYVFAVIDDANTINGAVVTYYVYNDKVITERRQASDEQGEKAILVYDGVDTSKVVYTGDNATEVCAVTVCKKKNKPLKVVKKIIADKVGREYVGR